MVSIIITPLIIYVVVTVIIIYFIKKCVEIVLSILKKPNNILYYKVHNILLSIIMTMTYVKFFIIIVYILRIYNIPRNLDLKQCYYFFQKVTLFSSTSLFIKICSVTIIMLMLFYVMLLVVLLHKKMYKEMHKIYIFFDYRDYLKQNKYTKKLYNILHEISSYDLVQYFFDEITFFMTKIIHGRYDFFSLPRYHFRRIYSYIFENRFYPKFITLSPVIIVFYDCIYNDFILSHVFYYLLFYIPLKLLHRISKTVGSSSYYITLIVWEACYSKNKVLYAISEKYKFILDDYLASGLRMNPDLHINSELFLYDHVRFGLIDKRELIYQNPDGIQIKRVGNKFFQIAEDDEGNTIFTEKWCLLTDNTQLNVMNNYNE